MNEEDAKRILKGLAVYAKETLSSKEKAIQSLQDAGLVDNNGNLSEIYKPVFINTTQL